MNEATLILSIVQTVVIVGSFIILIIQLGHSQEALKQSSETIRQSSRALQDNIDFKSLEYYVKLNDVMLNNQEVKEALFEGNEQNELYLFLALALSFFEDLYLRYRDGQLEEKIWAPWEKWLIAQFINNYAFPDFWDENSEYYVEEFCLHIQKLREQVKEAKRKKKQKN